MELKFDVSEIKNYHSNSQIARLLTENWIREARISEKDN